MDDALQERDLCPAVGGARAVAVDANDRIAAALAELHEVGENIAHRIVDAVEHIGDVDHIILRQAEILDDVHAAVGRRRLKAENVRARTADVVSAPLSTAL